MLKYFWFSSVVREMMKGKMSAGENNGTAKKWKMDKYLSSRL
jgi:hypothetical protein